MDMPVLPDTVVVPALDTTMLPVLSSELAAPVLIVIVPDDPSADEPVAITMDPVLLFVEDSSVTRFISFPEDFAVIDPSDTIAIDPAFLSLLPVIT
jgi:hypothetical protein